MILMMFFSELHSDRDAGEIRLLLRGYVEGGMSDALRKLDAAAGCGQGTLAPNLKPLPS